MFPESGGYPVDGSLEGGPESKAQRFIAGVSYAAGGPGCLTGCMGQLKVPVHRLERSEAKSIILA